VLIATFEIVIDGEVDPDCANVFAPAVVAPADGRTTIRAEAIDQAALHGILHRLESLGLTLLSVAQVA
jgi:hypothetical protein